MVAVHTTVNAWDRCGPAGVALESITSDESDRGFENADVNTVNDIQGANQGTPDFDFLLRAERMGRGEGRVYTITYAATDESGNAAAASTGVEVPHDHRGGTAPMQLEGSRDAGDRGVGAVARSRNGRVRDRDVQERDRREP
jgi:hypothetical protein